MAPSKRVADEPASEHVDVAKPDTSNPLRDDGAAEVALEALPPVKPMGVVECLRTYKYASLVCVLAAVGALSDGYQVQMSGSIVALPGFIRTFGDRQPDGEYVINPQYLALWGCKSASPTPFRWPG